MAMNSQFSIIKRQYTATVKVNSKGFVAQKTEDIVGFKEVTRVAYFANQETFRELLKKWSGGIWNYHESEQNRYVNEVINEKEITDFKEVDTYLESNAYYHINSHQIQWIKI